MCSNEADWTVSNNGSVISPQPFLRAPASFVLPLLVVSTVNVASILAFEAYVLCRAARSASSRRQLFLGQMLLLGLLLGEAGKKVEAMSISHSTCPPYTVPTYVY